MLSRNAFFFSGSAWSRLERKFPVTENACGCELSFGVMEFWSCQGSSPQIPKGPTYGDCETPLVPKNLSVTSHQPLMNCVEAKLTSTPSGYRKITLKLPQQSPSAGGLPARPPAAEAFSGCEFKTQLQMSITWMFCSTIMSPESTLS